MSNVKNAKRMDVVIYKDVEHPDAMVYAINHMGEDCQFPVDTIWNGQRYIVIDMDEDLTDETLIASGLEGVQHQLETSNPNDWLQEQGDYQTGEDTFLVVDFGTYHGDGIIVGVHYLEYA